MENVHETLHNELNYLSLVNNLLENHVERTMGGESVLCGFGVQTGFDLGKSFPALTCMAVDMDEAKTNALKFLKTNAKPLALLSDRISEGPDLCDLCTSVMHDCVTMVHVIKRDDTLDINIQISSVEVLHQLPALMAEMGYVALIFAAQQDCRIANLSIQMATLWVHTEERDDAQWMLNTEISPPAVVSIREGANPLKIKVADLVATDWADWAAA